MEQQIKLGEILSDDAVAPIHGGSFAISIGSVVPEPVELRPVPASVGALAPQFRNTSFIVVDEEIALVDPKTRDIIAVMQRWRRQN